MKEEWCPVRFGVLFVINNALSVIRETEAETRES